MKTENSKKFMRKKWSIKQCEDEKGWKLKNVRRVQIKAESLDGVKIMRELHTTNFDSKFDDRYWRVSDIHLIENDKLRTQFEEYKKELIELGRSPESVKETLAFSAETEKACKDICQEGYKVGSKKRHVLGHTGSGVHLVRHYDILTRYLMFQQYSSPAYIFVYKTFLGKTKPIVPRLHKDDHYVPPYAGFDSHISARHVDREMPICEALNCSYVYLYEFDQISSNTVKHPRQILPYVIIQLEKKIPSVPENPFLSVGSDASRSTWEVKGETRRGFRFVFTKSGLKGKHKVFSKGSLNFGSRLKGQILEMRTKSAGSVVDSKPPLLQKIVDNCTSRNTLVPGKNKPPDLQKLTAGLKQTNSKHGNLVLCKEIPIPERLRSIKQLTYLKPCVKLKRLNSNCLNRSSGEPKNKRVINRGQENKMSDCDLSSEPLVLNSSDLTPLQSDNIELCSSQRENTKVNEEINAEIISADNRIQFDNMNTETLTFNICDLTKGRDKTIALAQNKSTKLFSSQKVKNQNHDGEKKLTDKKLNNVLSNDIPSVVKITTSEIKDKTLHEETKRNSITTLAKCNNSNEKPDCVSENQISEKRIHLLTGSENTTKAIDKNRTLDPAKQKPVDNKTFSELKPGCPNSIQTTQTQLTTQGDSNSKMIPAELSTKQSQLETEQCVDANGKSGCTKNKTFSKNIDKNEVISRIGNQDSDCNIQNLNKKIVSSRCSPTKTKFGKIEYKVDKNKERQRCYLKRKSQMESRLTISRKQSPDIETKIQEYDFIDQDRSQNLKSSKQNVIDQIRTVTKQVSNQELKTLNDNVSENDKKNKNSVNEANDFSHILRTGNSFASLQSALGDPDKKAKRMSDTNEASSGVFADLSDADRTQSNPTQIQSQRMGIEKSKSPVVANAAPEMLNLSPILVSAKTSIHSISDSAKRFLNKSLKELLSPENKISINQDSDENNKGKHFFSEMTSIYNENASCIDLVKQFPEKISQTLIVNPVIRTSFSAKNGISSTTERTQLNTETLSDQQNRKPKSDSNIAAMRPSRSFKQKGKTSDAMHVTQRSETCLKNKEETGKQIIKSKDKSSKAQTTSKMTHTHQTKTSASMNMTLGGGSCKTNKTVVERSHEAISKDINSKKNDTCKPSDNPAGKNFSPTEGSCIKAIDSSSKNKGHDCRTPRGVKESKVKTTPSDISVKLNNKTKKTACNIEEGKTKENWTDKLEVNQNDLNNVGRLSLKNTLKNRINDKTDDSDNDICEQVKLENKTINKKVIMPKSMDEDVEESQKTTLKEAVPPTEDVTSAKSSSQKQQMFTTSEFATQNSLEQIHEFCSSENLNNVRIDTLTADKFRSFLSSTAAVAMQHRKSVEEKSETDENMDKSGLKQSSYFESRSLTANVLQSSPANQEFENQVSKNITIPVSQDQECQNEKYGVETKRYTHSNHQKQRLQTISKEPFKNSKSNVFKRTGRGSSEIHDSDSQETIIGGVPHSPIQPLPPFASLNDSKKNNKSNVTSSKALALQENMTCIIKQETVDDQEQVKSVTEKGIENIFPHSEDTHSEIVNHVSSTNECQNDLISAENIKTEPVDQELTEKQFTTVNDTEAHPVKIEPFSPDTSTTFFPKIRKELEKGTALLDANQCRSAIVDTLKELSFVLKFLTDNNGLNANKKEQATLVAEKMCNEFTKERLNLITTGDEFEQNPGYELHVKHEQNDAESSDKQPLENLNLTQDESICHNVSEEPTYEHFSNDQGFQYDYILKSSEDEYQSTNESIVEGLSLPESEMTQLVCSQSDISKLEHKNSSLKSIKSTLDGEITFVDQHEKDELPQLFDPNDEPDITILEQFGIPLSKNNLDSKTYKAERHYHTEKETDDHAVNLELPGVTLVKDIKMEREKIIECATVKTKQKQNFSLKSGILNKGLKERKNMFDLKINATRSFAVGNFKQSENKCVPPKKMNINKLTSAQPKQLAKKEQTFEGCQNVKNDIMNEVYKTVCEKLSLLKENDIQENDNLFQQRYISESVSKKKLCESSMNPENPVSIKEMHSQKAPGDNETINDPSMLNPLFVKLGTTKTNNKKDTITPFQSKEPLLRKNKREETNKRFIDTRDFVQKISTRDDKQSSLALPKIMHNQDISGASQILETNFVEETEEISNPSHKISEINEQGNILTEGGSNQESTPGKLNGKRSSSETEENANPKHMKFSSEKCQPIENDSNRRSRSRSSHRSSSSRQRTSMNSSVGENPESPSYSGRNFPYPVQPKFFNNRPYQRAKQFHASRGFFNARGTYRNYPTRYSMSTNRYCNFSGKASFNKGGTGYFSWRRKYQPKRNAFEGFMVTEKGSVVSVSEYEEWSRFKERETIRDQIENAIKEYRRTFEDTPDDMKGDEKVASYLTFLTDKLDKIQNKRNKLIPQGSTENRRENYRSKRRSSSERKTSRSPQPEKDRPNHIFRKLEKAHNIHQLETQQHSSVARFSGSLASDSDNLSYKQRRHASGIEELLKEHLSKHYEHLTRQIKQEMDDLKTSKLEPSRKEHKKSSYEKDRHRSKYDNKYNHDKYRSHSQEGYDSKRSSRSESSRTYGDYKHSGKDRYNSQRCDKHGERYSYEDKYARRHDSFREHNADYDSRKRNDFQYNSSYRAYGSDRNHGNLSTYKNPRNYEDRNHNRNNDYRKTYDYQQNYDKYQNRFHTDYRGLRYFDKKKNDYGIDTERTFDLRDKMLQPKMYMPKPWIRGKYNKFYNNDTVEISDETEDTQVDVNAEAAIETAVKDEFDATKYREFIPALRGFNKRGRGFFRGAHRFNPGYKLDYTAAKFRNPKTYYYHEEKDTDNCNTDQDAAQSQKCGISVESAKEKIDKTD